MRRFWDIMKLDMQNKIIKSIIVILAVILLLLCLFTIKKPDTESLAIHPGDSMPELNAVYNKSLKYLGADNTVYYISGKSYYCVADNDFMVKSMAVFDTGGKCVYCAGISPANIAVKEEEPLKEISFVSMILKYGWPVDHGSGKTVYGFLSKDGFYFSYTAQNYEGIFQKAFRLSQATSIIPEN